jgi:hypothetical protein
MVHLDATIYRIRSPAAMLRRPAVQKAVVAACDGSDGLKLYKGSGDANDDANFACATPTK